MHKGSQDEGRRRFHLQAGGALLLASLTLAGPSFAGSADFPPLGNWRPFPDSIAAGFVFRIEDSYDPERVDPLPRISLGIRSERSADYAPEIDWKVKVEKARITVRLIGLLQATPVISIGGMGGVPAAAQTFLELPERRYELRFLCRGYKDTYDLSLSDSAFVLVARKQHFTRPAAVIQARYPPRSFTLLCRTGEECRSFCDDLARALQATGRCREIRLADNVELPAPYARFGLFPVRIGLERFFRYGEEADFDSAAAVLRGFRPRLETWCASGGACLHNWRNRYSCLGTPF
jgi:hypothetical protein